MVKIEIPFREEICFPCEETGEIIKKDIKAEQGYAVKFLRLDWRSQEEICEAVATVVAAKETRTREIVKAQRSKHEDSGWSDGFSKTETKDVLHIILEIKDVNETAISKIGLSGEYFLIDGGVGKYQNCWHGGLPIK